jgi:hypothetical protein
MAFAASRDGSLVIAVTRKAEKSETPRVCTNNSLPSEERQAVPATGEFTIKNLSRSEHSGEEA